MLWRPGVPTQIKLLTSLQKPSHEIMVKQRAPNELNLAAALRLTFVGSHTVPLTTISETVRRLAHVYRVTFCSSLTLNQP